MKIEKTPATTAVHKRKKTSTSKSRTKNPANAKHTIKSEDERFELKHEIAIRLRKGQSRNRVAETMQEDGFDISKNSVYAYAKQIHEEWVKTKNDSYELHVSKQLAMLDQMIEQCWVMLDKSKQDAVTTTTEFGFQYDEGKEENEENGTSDENPKGRTKIRRVGLKSEGPDENPKGRKRQISEKIQKVSRDGDVEILKMLERLWIRRCEILGIVLNTTINIQNNQFNSTTQIVANENKPISEQFFQAVVIEEDVRNVVNQKIIDDAIIDEDEND